MYFFEVISIFLDLSMDRRFNPQNLRRKEKHLVTHHVLLGDYVAELCTCATVRLAKYYVMRRRECP